MVLDPVGNALGNLEATGDPAFWLAAGAMDLAALAMLAYPFVLFFRPRRQRIAAYLPFVGLVLFTVGVVWLVARGRAWAFGAFLHPAPAHAPGWARMIDGLGLQLDGLAMLQTWLGLLALCIPIMGLPWAIARRRERKPFGLTLLTAFGLFVLASLPVEATVRWATTISQPFAGGASLPPLEHCRSISRALLAANRKLALDRLAVLLTGAVALAAGCLRAVKAARRGQVVSQALLACAALVFLAGSLAFTATRAEAADASPLPIDPNAGADLSPLDGQEVPVVADCGPRSVTIPAAPTIFIGKQLRVASRNEPNLDVLTSDLMTFFENQRRMHPEDPLSAHPAVDVVADPRVATAPLLLRLTSQPVRVAVYVIATAPPVVVETHTLGRLEQPRACAYPVPPNATRFQTFGALAQALANAR